MHLSGIKGQGADPITADTAMDHQAMSGVKMKGSAPSHSTCAQVPGLLNRGQAKDSDLADPMTTAGATSA